jgi:hypothetical protein
MAIVSLPVALAFPPVGVPLAHVARAQVRASGERGRGLTTAALVLGYLVGGAWVIFWASIILSVLVEDLTG